MNTEDIEFDRGHIWHPYTSTLAPLPCYSVEKAEGVTLYLDDGRALIDGMSSWWAAVHGYQRPELTHAAKIQLDKMSHVMFGGITHQSAVDLCKKLVSMTPEPLQHVFLSDSGSVAVEVALKMALQYWAGREEVRSKFLTIRRGYHGDTFAAMSVTDPDNSMHNLYKGFLTEHVFANAPECGFYDEWDPADFVDFKEKMQIHHKEIAAVILEPIVQGAGGMRFYHPEYLKAVRAICDEYEILLICDEIATGFGRTGKLFASEYAGIEPDIMCIGKALTGGYMSLAATLTTKEVADTVCSGEAGCFMHGPTFMANPLACAVASASMDIILQNKWQGQVKEIEEQLAYLLPPLSRLPAVKEVRSLGAIGVVETHKPVNMEKLQASFVKSGVWIRPFGRLVYIMPPYIIKACELAQLVQAIEKGLQDV